MGGIRGQSGSSDDGPTDSRTAGQKRADALVLICGFFLDHHTTRPTSGGQRPHVAVTVDLQVLARTAPGRAMAPRVHGGLDADTARQLCCDPAVTRVITNGRSGILDVGRKTRVIPTGLRTAVEQRDRCCRAPGCDTPAWFTEVHHIIHWADGGVTTRTNCCLFCRKHHKMIHHGWTVTGNANLTLTFTAPDGTLYHTHPPGLPATSAVLQETVASARPHSGRRYLRLRSMLFDGYWDDPEATSRKLVRLRITDGLEQRALRTGVDDRHRSAFSLEPH